jgi:hypothetical protein
MKKAFKFALQKPILIVPKALVRDNMRQLFYGLASPQLFSTWPISLTFPKGEIICPLVAI